MIEELKVVLDTIGDLGASAVWLAIGFIGLKLVMYLSTTGAIVFLVKMFIEKLHNYAITPPPPPHPAPQVKEKDIEIQGMCITADGTYQHVIETLKLTKAHVNTSSGMYLHSKDAGWLRNAVEEKIKREGE